MFRGNPFKKSLLSVAFVASVFSLSSEGAIASPVEGIWKTEGYGYLIAIKGDDVSLYEQTAISCQKGALSTGSLETHKLSEVEAQFHVSLPGFIDAMMEIYQGADVKQKLFHRTDTNTFMVAEKLKELPADCLAAVDNSNANSGAVFAQTFKEHYPFFETGFSDWISKANLNSDLNDQQLFEALTNLLVPLKDSHTALVAPSLEEMYFGAEENAAELSDEDKAQAKQIVEGSYLSQPLTYLASGQIGFSTLKDGSGYLRVDGFYGFSEDDTDATNLVELNKALDVVFSGSNALSGLVIDIRHNGGGSDALASALASRLTNKEYVAYAKQALVSGGDNMVWTNGRATAIKPSNKKAFDGPVFLLTGQNTVSAAETFTMALMERAPTVMRIGAATRGAFADMLPRVLPNGWLFALPNERYLDKAGNNYDRTGIPPHKVTPVFSKTDLQEGRDSALDAVFEVMAEWG